MCMKRLFSIILAISFFAASVSCKRQIAREAAILPILDGNSSKGLEIECSLTKSKFMIGEPVNVWCMVRNTTDIVKPVGWHSNTGLHFCYVQGDKKTVEGLLPRAFPQLKDPVMMKSRDMQPDYVLFIPPQKSILFILTHKPERPEKFKGRVCYDPVAPRDGWITTKVGENDPPWKNELIFSNEFEYEMTAE